MCGRKGKGNRKGRVGIARQWRKSRGKDREERRKGQGRKNKSKDLERAEGSWKATHSGMEVNKLEYNHLKKGNLPRGLGLRALRRAARRK